MRCWALCAPHTTWGLLLPTHVCGPLACKHTSAGCILMHACAPTLAAQAPRLQLLIHGPPMVGAAPNSTLELLHKASASAHLQHMTGVPCRQARKNRLNIVRSSCIPVMFMCMFQGVHDACASCLTGMRVACVVLRRMLMCAVHECVCVCVLVGAYLSPARGVSCQSGACRLKLGGVSPPGFHTMA